MSWSAEPAPEGGSSAAALQEKSYERTENVDENKGPEAVEPAGPEGVESEGPEGVEPEAPEATEAASPTPR